ncbi:hypothetical protein [Paenibacillus nuruki]|uniref:hypothetical protein n=1 Tax=Paenibacillus nuruki TaxID=1886670 RepID=UPI00280431B8|nr:hypothetical protein [Paenibacillus nuruki]CAJ1315887.1 hypothetical protein AASFL403_11740 [Paenibacillus nuruki]
MNKKLNDEATATKYLREQYKVGNYFNLGFGAISKKQDLLLKTELIQKESFENLSSIHSGTEAKYEFMKQLGLIITVIIFLITTLFGTLSFYLQQSMRNIDWTHETIMLEMKAKADLLDSSEWLKEPSDLYKAKYELYNENLLQQIASFNDQLTIVYKLHYRLTLAILIFLAISFNLVWLKYSWLSSIHFCVKEAYKQKEKLHDQTLKLRKERLSLMK